MLINVLISISLKVVNMALVFWEPFSFWAIVSLILFMGTLVSVRVPVIPVGAMEPVEEEDVGGLGASAFGVAAGFSSFFGGA
jgi:predicted MFS family arabinose efflux permease